MNEFTEQLKLSKIPDAEIGERIKAFVYIFVHLYCFYIVSRELLKNFITTQTIKQTELWQGPILDQKRWIEPSSSEPPKLIDKRSKQQQCSVVSTAHSSSASCSSRKTFSHLLEPLSMKPSRPKPVGFKNA